MREQLEEIKRRAMSELADSATDDQIEAVRVRVLGRSGELTEIMRGMRNVPNSERPAMGQLINQLKREVEERSRVERALHGSIVALLHQHDFRPLILDRVDSGRHRVRWHEDYRAKAELPRHPGDGAPMIPVGRRRKHGVPRHLVRGQPVVHRERGAESLEGIETKAMRLVLEQQGADADMAGERIELVNRAGPVVTEAAMK